jgi:hypothetical protein
VWSANREYLVSNPAAVGHAWLTVAAPNGDRVDIGYYPVHTSTLAPGSLHVGDTTHQTTQDAAYTYRITPEQAARILDAATHVRAEPNEYNVFNHNCLTVAHELLAAGGLPVPGLDRIGSGTASATAWKTGEPVPPLHDPAGYNGLLRSTPEGQAARALYEHSSELSGMRTGSLDGLRQEAHDAAHDDQAAQNLHHPTSTYLGEIDDPHFLDPQQSIPDSGDPQHCDVDYSTSAHHDDGYSGSPDY